jgi:hypothetical protein
MMAVKVYDDGWAEPGFATTSDTGRIAMPGWEGCRPDRGASVVGRRFARRTWLRLRFESFDFYAFVSLCVYVCPVLLA